MQEPVDGAADEAPPLVGTKVGEEAGAQQAQASVDARSKAQPPAALVPPPVAATAEKIAVAAAVLRDGGLVAIPTETVYGLAADARNPKALARLYKVKGRPGTHPVIVHIADAGGLDEWAREVPEYARALAAKFWPGPLTLVLPRAAFVSDAVTGGQDSVGLRVPAHPVAQQLLRGLDEQTGSVGAQTSGSSSHEAGAPGNGANAQGGRYFGLAAPSANRFGRVSPTEAEHVRADLGAAIGTEVDMILDGGPCDVGIESTIVDCTGPVPVVLRPGRINEADIAACTAPVLGANDSDTDDDINAAVGQAADTTDAGSDASPAAEGVTGSENNPPRAKTRAAGKPTRAPGTLAAHYAPRAKLRLVKRSGMIETISTNRGSRLAALALEIPVARLSASFSIVVPAVASRYARALYANLRLLDAAGADVILVESPPDTPAWAAVLDRLRRAETKEPVKKRKAASAEPGPASPEATSETTFEAAAEQSPPDATQEEANSAG